MTGPVSHYGRLDPMTEILVTVWTDPVKVEVITRKGGTVSTWDPPLILNEMEASDG